MAKNKRKVGIVGIIVIIFLVTIGVSYALWSITLQQTDTNVITTGCFQIEFSDINSIHLEKTYPISDEAGMKLTPYTFTIENVCSTNATYQINLEELVIESKRLSNKYVKVSLNNSKGKLLNTYEEVSKTIDNADVSHKLTTGVLKAGDSKTFELRLWLDENTPATSETMNAAFESKITIVAVQKEGIPEVEIMAFDNLNEITVDISTVENPKNETLTYFYQLNEDAEIESEENTHTFTGLSDGKYKAKGRAETLDGVILEEKELDVTIAYETVYVSASGNDETGNGSLENPFATLQPAYNKVKSGGEILLLSNIRATSTTNMNIENKEVTLRSNEGNIYTILKDPSFTTQILDITNSNTVTTMNIIFDGNEVISSAALIEAYDSTLNLNEGTTVQKNNNRGRYYEEWNASGSVGGGILMLRGNLNIHNANINNNKVSAIEGVWSNGGGIYMNESTLNFFEGIISNNENLGVISSQNGGGICFLEGTFNMYGGTISNNKSNLGGGIFIDNNTIDTTMIMSGGLIKNNTSQNGGGIFAYVEPNSNKNTFVYLKGGTISNNNAPTGPDTYAAGGAQIIDQR